MTLHFIGLGLGDEKDISLRGLEILKNCEFVYLESYTSILQSHVSHLEKLYGKKIVLADRDMIENKADFILDKAKNADAALLVVGDPFCATTHSDLFLRAKEKGVKVGIVHNTSIISAIGELGLEIYKYGKITSIPFLHANVKTPIVTYEINMKEGMHTLFLLDLDPVGKKFLTIKEAGEYLISNGVKKDTLAVGCARIGADKTVHAGKLGEIISLDYGKPPYCIVIPGKLHFMEEEMLKQWE